MLRLLWMSVLGTLLFGGLSLGMIHWTIFNLNLLEHRDKVPEWYLVSSVIPQMSLTYTFLYLVGSIMAKVQRKGVAGTRNFAHCAVVAAICALFTTVENLPRQRMLEMGVLMLVLSYTVVPFYVAKLVTHREPRIADEAGS